ncbi:MAG: VanZ family protein [Acetatifactor sp.]
MRKKLMITIPAVFLLVGLYCLIFSLSSDEGEKSGSKSHLVSQTCVEIVNQVTGRKWTQAVKAQLADYYEHPIRKLAHFSEYCLMGILLFVIWSQWIPRNKVFYLMILSWVFLSAGLDEIHQLFVDGRDGNFFDVLIDTLGGAFGLFVSFRLSRLFRRRRGK